MFPVYNSFYNLHKKWTYVRTLTIAIGMPVGVLNAGISLSAISIALFLNIYKHTHTFHFNGQF